jgi:hypothetical protein
MLCNFIHVGREKEVTMILDTEFILQYGKIRSTRDDDFLSNMIVPPVSLHTGKHAWEVLVEQILFILFILASFYDHLGFKPTTFKHVENHILKLLKEAEISPIFWGENQEPRAPFNIEECRDDTAVDGVETKDDEIENKEEDNEVERPPVVINDDDDGNEDNEFVVNMAVVEEKEKLPIDQLKLQKLLRLLHH